MQTGSGLLSGSSGSQGALKEVQGPLNFSFLIRKAEEMYPHPPQSFLVVEAQLTDIS